MRFGGSSIGTLAVLQSCVSGLIVPEDTNGPTSSEFQSEESSAITKRDFPWYMVVEEVTSNSRIIGAFLIWSSLYNFGNLAFNLLIAYDECIRRENRELIPRGRCRKAIKDSVWYLSTSAVTIYGLINAVSASHQRDDVIETIQAWTKEWWGQLIILLFNLSVVSPQKILPNGKLRYPIIMIMMGCALWHMWRIPQS